MSAGQRARYRILLVSNLLPPQVEGGAERVAWGELRGLASRGHQVCGLAPQWGDLSPREDVEEEGPGPAVYRVPSPSRRSRRPGNEFAANPRLLRKFSELLLELDPDLIHFHHLNGISLRLPAMARRRGFRTLATLHDGWGVCPKGFLLKPDGSRCSGFQSFRCVSCLGSERRKRFSTRRVALLVGRNRRVRREMRRIDRLLFPSRHHREMYVRAGFSAERTRLLPNPAPPPPLLPVPPPDGSATGPLRLLYLGSLPTHKGIEVLLDALAQVSADTARLVLHGIEVPEELAWFAAAVRERRLEDRVEHRGYLSGARVPEAISRADLLVVPSLGVENSPLSILEAMARGRPVIASRLGGIPELVEDGVSGCTFPPGDAGALRSLIERLASDRSGLQRMGARAGVAVGARGLPAHLDRLEGLYAELLEPSRNG